MLGSLYDILCTLSPFGTLSSFDSNLGTDTLVIMSDTLYDICIIDIIFNLVQIY
jgi:hypothetical protein